MLGPTDAPQASQPGEIVLLGGEGGWYDYEAKYTPGGMELRRAGADLRRGARARARAGGRPPSGCAGCSGLARADFFVDGDDVLLNELNTMPGFTQTSVYGEALGRTAACPTPSSATGSCAIAVERFERERLRLF